MQIWCKSTASTVQYIHMYNIKVPEGGGGWELCASRILYLDKKKGVPIHKLFFFTKNLSSGKIRSLANWLTLAIQDLTLVATARWTICWTRFRTFPRPATQNLRPLNRDKTIQKYVQIFWKGYSINNTF